MTILELPPLEIPTEKGPPWHCDTRGTGGGACDVTPRGTFEIKYKRGCTGVDSGITVHASPPQIFPADAVELRYRVLFKKPWAWKEGGKLPGLVLGDGASGGDWTRDGGSVRAVFKQKGGCCGYVYIPLQVASRKRMDAVQTREYGRVVYHTKKGDHLWKDGEIAFKIGEWNDVRLRVTLDVDDESPGTIELEVNGIVERLPIKLRTDKTLKITGLGWTTFFGGSSVQARAPPNAVAEFDGVSLQKVR